MRRSSVLLLGAATVTGALGAAALVAARRRPAPVLPTRPLLPPLPGRPLTVTTSDGVALSVSEHGSTRPSGTVVLAHGYVLSDRCWSEQVRALVTARPDLRVLTYDQHGHGRSGRSPADGADLAHLGADLAALLDQLVPDGPVLLVGHSMGGMTIMSLAEQFPGLFGSRVRGVALLSTSPGRLSEVTWGLPKPVAAVLHRVLPLAYEKARRDEAAGKRPRQTPGVQRLLFGPGVDPGAVTLVLEIMAGTPAATTADFYATFSDHDRVEALSALAGVPVLVLVGDRDLICPIGHSRAIAEALPHARLVVYPGAGHMLMQERPDEVDRQLVDLAAAVLPAVPDRAPAPA